MRGSRGVFSKRAMSDRARLGVELGLLKRRAMARVSPARLLRDTREA